MMKGKKVSRSKRRTSLLFMSFIFIIISSIVLLIEDEFKTRDVIVVTTEVAKKQAPIILKHEEPKEEVKAEPVKEEVKIVYDNMTMEQLANKLNKSMYGILAGKGSVFANYSIQYGVDPYLSLAIVLQETGCKWNCSYLARVCNNIGGQVGTPSCGGGSYRSFATLDEGIRVFFENLSYNYYQQGLTDVYSIHKKYAQDPSWPTYINNYINEIRAK